RRQLARRPGAAPRVSGARRAAGPRLRGPRRRPHARRAGLRPSHQHAQRRQRRDPRDPRRDPPHGARARLMRRHLELTHRGHLCLALLHLTAGAAWLTGDDNARLAASMLAAPLVLDVLHKLVRAPRIALSVALRRVHARSSFLESVEVRNVSATQPVRDLTLGEPRTQLYESGGAFIPWLEPGASVTVRIAARSARRGCFTSRTFVAETWHPFGLLRWRATFDLR